MRQTLFHIPHEFLGIPVLGFGWALAAIVLFAVVFLLISRKNQSISKLLEEQGIILGVAALIVVFLLPLIEERISDGSSTPWIVGLPIRGYGVMLMLGVVSAVSVAMMRCDKAGLSREAFFSLATWTIVAGMIGARVFYCVQKWDELGGTLGEKLWKSIQVTEGGLVVYGSVIGGMIAIAFWSRKHRFPLLKLADCVTPAFFIGLAFGRIGCFLNGCCYGGLCESSLPSITFPSGSPAYVDQLQSGKLFGIGTQASQDVGGGAQDIVKVTPDSWASANNIQAGQKLVSIREMMFESRSRNAPLAAPVFEATVQVDSRQFQIAAGVVPKRSMPVHPSQIYAAVSGLVLFLWICSLSAITKRTGLVFGVALIAYGVQRIIEEIIRVDEAGQFGTSLSIAQWISLGGILLGLGLVVFAKQSALKASEESAV